MRHERNPRTTSTMLHGTAHVCAPVRVAVRPTKLVARSGEGPSVGDDGHDERRLVRASRRWEAGKKEGVDEDEIVAKELQLGSAAEMTDVQAKYKDKIKGKLSEKAKELKGREANARKVFQMGQNAYERGAYQQSADIFEYALENVTKPNSMVGGEIQLWLALSYDALGKYEDCLSLYRSLEKEHPSQDIKKRAAELRFILEAPKLEIGEDERVKIPIMDDSSGYNDRRFSSTKRPASRRRELTLEERFLENYQPPKVVSNRYFWVALTVVLAFLAVYSRQMVSAPP